MPNSSIRIIQFLFVVFSVGLVSGCAPAANTPTPTAATPIPAGTPPVNQPPVTASNNANNVFDPSQVKPGDRVAGLEVVSVDVQPFQNRGYVGTVQFRGELTLSGTYKTDPSADAPSSKPCFFVNPASASQLPRFTNDERIAWFCFSNPDEAQKLLGQPTAADQPAVVVVDNYTTIYQPTDAVNTARLVRGGAQPSPQPGP